MEVALQLAFGPGEFIWAQETVVLEHKFCVKVSEWLSMEAVESGGGGENLVEQQAL